MPATTVNVDRKGLRKVIS